MAAVAVGEAAAAAAAAVPLLQPVLVQAAVAAVLDIQKVLKQMSGAIKVVLRF